MNYRIQDKEGHLEIPQVITEEQKLSDDIDLRQLAKDITGFVHADLRLLCTTAVYNDINNENCTNKVIGRLAGFAAIRLRSVISVSSILA